jgi:hypothetical protein
VTQWTHRFAFVLAAALVLAGCSGGNEANSKPSTAPSTGGTSASETTHVCMDITGMSCPGAAVLKGTVKSSDPSHPLPKDANLWIRMAQLIGSQGRACTLNQCGISATALGIGHGLAPGRWVFVAPAMPGFRRPPPITVSLQAGGTTLLSIIYQSQG